MRKIGWIVFFFIWAYGDGLSQMLILHGDTNEKAIRVASLKLQLELAQNPLLEQLFEKHKLTLDTRRFGHFHALVVQPIRSIETRNALKLALGSRYGGMFFVEKETKFRQSARPFKPRPTEHPKEAMETIDWAWLMIFILAVTGLTASIIQRKKIFVFKNEQTRFKDDQDQMDHEIETLQGEKHD